MTISIEQKAKAISRHLAKKYHVAKPISTEGFTRTSAEYSDYENISKVIGALTFPLDTSQPGVNLLDPSLLEPELLRVADIAFKIAKIATKEKVEPSLVVHNYVMHLLLAAHPSQPLNLISNRAFESMSFKKQDGGTVSGKDLLKKAVRGLLFEASATRH